MSQLQQFVVYISIIIWMLPPIKNRGSEYFSYFLLLALDDPINVLVIKLLHVQPNVISTMFGFFLLASLVKKKTPQIVLLALSFIVTVGIHALRITVWSSTYLNSLLQIIVVIIIANRIISALIRKNSLNLFLALFFFYASITLFRRIALIMNPGIGAVSFWIGGFMQLFFGIIFTFINVNTKNFKLAKELA